MNLKQLKFVTEEGESVPAVSPDQLKGLISSLQHDFLIPESTIIESASLSYSMVVRSALGLTASEAGVCALITDSLSGRVTLSTVRMLSNAGAQCVVILLEDLEKLSAELELQLQSLDRAGVPLVSQYPDPDLHELEKLFSQTHTVLAGISDISTDLSAREALFSKIIPLLNELHTPIHTILSPPGVSQESGKTDPGALLASSTLSLGVPLAGLASAPDFIGRHYLCDIQIPRKVYSETFEIEPGWFSRQPVIQIYAESIKTDKE